jgi:hypothetical protein
MGSVINYGGILTQDGLGLAVETGRHLMDLKFVLAAPAFEPDLAAAAYYFQFHPALLAGYGLLCLLHPVIL